MSRETSLPNTLKRPPRAPGLPLLGNTLDLIKDPLALFARMYEELGPVFSVAAPGRTYVVLAGPEANRRFIEWEDKFLIGGPVYRPYVDDLETEQVLIAMDGEPHRTYRKWLRPGFSREAIAPHLPRMIDEAAAIVASWRDEESLNVIGAIQFLVAQLSGIALASCPIGDHFGDAKTFAHTFLGAGVGSFPGFMRRFPRYRRARGRFLAFLKAMIASRRSAQPEGHTPDLIDLLLRGDAPLGKSLTEADILASAHMPFTNSLVYIASTCGFMLYELLRHPDVLHQVQLEVDTMFGDGPPDLAAFRKSTWLRAALMETQRLHPISLSLPRYVHRSFEFEGYLIEAGSLTLTATAVTHFLPSFFPDPYRFDASRYLPPRREHLHPGMLVPYGLGPHVCLSAGVVNALALLSVGSMLYHAKFALEPADYDLRISVAPFPAPARDFKVRLTKRRPDVDFRPRVPQQESGEEVALELEEILPQADAASLAQATSRSKRIRYGAGTTIFNEGDPADALYIISSGRVEVIKDVAGAPKIVAELADGAYFGEIGLLHDVPRTASIRTATEVETIVLEREAFVTLVADTDMTSGEIAAVMHRRLVSTTLAKSLPKLALDQIAEIAPRFELTSFEPGSTIIRQGDTADRFFIIVRGEVEVLNQHPDGRELRLAMLEEGEYFGEIGLLQGRPRNATVRAKGEAPVMVITLGRDAFLELMSDSDATSAQMALQMAGRLAELIDAGTTPK